MKAILVFDKMPNSCDECEVRCTGYTAKDYAQKGIKRPSWCPIRPLPDDVTKEETGAYVKGFHDALISEVDDESNDSN